MVLLLAGPNAYFKRNWIKSIKDNNPGFRYIIFDGDEPYKTNVSTIDAVLSQISLFDEPKKIIHVRNWMRSDITDYLSTKTEKYLSDEALILVLDSQEMLRSNAKIRKLVDSKNIIPAENFAQNEISNLISTLLKNGDINEIEYAKKALMERVDKDPFIIESEINKLITLNKFRPITKQDIDGSIIPSIAFSIWEYMKYATSGKIGPAMNVLNSLIENGENEFAILGLIQWNIRLISVLLSSRNIDATIAKDFGYSPYSIKPAREVLSRYSLKKITLMYQKVIDLEDKMKSGKIEAKLGLLLLTMVF